MKQLENIMKEVLIGGIAFLITGAIGFFAISHVVMERSRNYESTMMEAEYQAEALAIFAADCLHDPARYWFCPRLRELDTHGQAVLEPSAIQDLFESMGGPRRVARLVISNRQPGEPVDERAVDSLSSLYGVEVSQAIRLEVRERCERGGMEIGAHSVPVTVDLMNLKPVFTGDCSDERFEERSLNRATFYRSDLSDARFSGVDLSSALFVSTDLSGTSFESSDLTNAEFRASKTDDIEIVRDEQ